MTGQSTVTGTISAYAGGSIIAIFRTQGGGSPAVTQTSTTIAANGTFSLTAWDNTNALYAPSQTTFLISEGTSTNYSATTTVIGTSVDISAIFSNAPAPPTSQVSGDLTVTDTVYTAESWIPEPSMTAFRTALHNVSSSPTSLVVIGDSILAGVGPSTITNSPIPQLVDYLAPYPVAGSGLIPIGYNNGLATNPYWSITGTWSTVQDYGPFQNGVGGFGSLFTAVANGNSNSATLASPFPGAELILYGASYPGDTGFNVYIDGNQVATGVGAYVSGPTTLFRVVVATGYAPLAHTVGLIPTSGGSGHVYGAEWIAPNPDGVIVHNLAHGYARSEAYGAAPSTQLAFVNELNPVPSGAVISLGVNDSIDGESVTPAQYQSNMQAIINYLLSVNPQMSILILDEQNVSSPGTPLTQTQIRAVEKSLVLSNSLAYASTADVWGTEANANTLGLMAGDGTHPSDKGGRSIGAILYNSLTDGAEPTGPLVPVAPPVPGGAYQLKNWPNDLSSFVGACSTVALPVNPIAGEVRVIVNNGGSSVPVTGSQASLSIAAGGSITLINGVGNEYWFITNLYTPA